MAQIAKKYQDRLKEIKGNIEEAYEYFKPNVEHYHETRRFVFESNLTTDERDKLNELKRPPLEFNVSEAYISRLRGEFSKQEPSVSVHAANETRPVSVPLINFLEGHYLYILEESKRDLFQFNTYTDQLSGAFSVMKVWTEYLNEKSFLQKIRLGRVYEPTLTGFDPMARLPHKGDGNYCFEIFPMTKEDFKRQYPKVDLTQLTFSKSIQGFSWSYKSGKKEMLLLCNYYEKKKKKGKIYQLADNSVVTPEQYEEILMQFEESRTLMQAPAIKDERITEYQIICRYQIIENQVLDYVETNFKFLPLIFVDGNSMILREAGEGSAFRQYVRSYIKNAIDAQRLKNVCGQTIANEIENMVTHKFMVPIEGIPERYEDAYTNPQKPSTLVYNAFKGDGTPIPPPQAVMRAPMPPEVTNMFMSMDEVIQAALGSYDAALGINNNQLSGVAIVEGATQSNATAMPYVVNFIAALNQAAQIILDLIPKYYITPRKLPVINQKGEKNYVSVNDGSPNSINLNYDPSDLNVSVEAGVNFEIQKSRSLQTMTQLAQAFPSVAALINQKGLPILIDNLDIRGVEQLKQMAEQFMQQMAQQQQMQQQAAMNGQQNNPEMLKMQLEHQKMMQETQFRAMELQLEQQKLENEKLKTALQYASEHEDNTVQLAKAATERDVHKANIALKTSDQIHQHHKDAMDHVKDMIDLAHTINQPTGDMNDGNQDISQSST